MNGSIVSITDKKSTTVGKNYILAIAVDEYKNDSFKDLSYAINDAKRFIDVLINRYTFEREQVIELFQEKATKSAIINIFNKLIDSITENDNLVIFIAGHGTLNKQDEGFYIAQDSTEQEDSLVGHKEIANKIKYINSRHTLLILDSCYSGSFFFETRSYNFHDRVGNYKSRYAIASGGAKQLVLDKSPFLERIIKLLNEENQSSEISVQEVAQIVKESVGSNYEQLPIADIIRGAGHEGGEFSFRLRQDHDTAWEEAELYRSLKSYQFYLKQYPKGKFSEQAHQSIQTLLLEKKDWKIILESTIESYKNFNQTYENNNYLNESNKIIELLSGYLNIISKEFDIEIDWQNVITTKSEIEIKNFLEKYFDFEEYATQARELLEKISKEHSDETLWLETIKNVKSKTKPEDKRGHLSHYLLKNTDGKYRKEAADGLKDISDFISARDTGTNESFQNYIKKHPTGNCITLAENALKQLSKAAFIKQKEHDLDKIIERRNLEDLEDFIENHLIPEISDKAISKREELEEEIKVEFEYVCKKDSVETYKDFLKNYPKNVYTDKVSIILESKDEQAFIDASLCNKLEDYRYYLDCFPKGIYINDAKSRIEQLQMEEAQKKAIEDSEKELLNYIEVYVYEPLTSFSSIIDYIGSISLEDNTDKTVSFTENNSKEIEENKDLYSKDDNLNTFYSNSNDNNLLILEKTPVSI